MRSLLLFLTGWGQTSSLRRMFAWLSAWWRHLSPHAVFVASFALLISVGTAGLLFLPGLYTRHGLGFVDALFMATSAACVTGLGVVNTATYFTFWGQLWILLLVQLGGLGLIGMTSAIISLLGQRLSLRTEMVAVASVKEMHGQDLLKLTRAIVRFTLVFELGLAAVLWVQWGPEYGVWQGLWHAVFHAVAAFCNAGLSTFPDSLMASSTQPGILVPISVVIIVGGLGYFSLVEVQHWVRADGMRGPARLSSHTWAAIVVTGVLLAIGTLAFIAFEWSGVLRGMGVIDKLINSWFMATSARTAGFNSVDYEQVGNHTAYITIVLMIIGGSPGSTAGGIKTTAVAILLAMAWSRTRGRRFVELHHRTLPASTVDRTVSLTLLFFILIGAVNFLLTSTESGGSLEASRQAFLPLLFEAASAAGTVGLSMGATAELSPWGRFLVIVTMFIGRVGPLAFFAAISVRSAKLPSDFRPAQEDVIVG